MTTQSLFGPTPTITFADEAEAIYDMALKVLFGVGGTIPWIRFWGTLNAINTEPFAAVYEPDGDLRYSQTFGPGAGLLTNQWNQLNLNTPVPVSAGETLHITVGPRNRYAGTSGIFPLSNGADLSASGSLFKVSTILEHPDTDSAAWFGIDVGFDPTPLEIAGTLQAAAAAAQFAAAGRILIRGSMEAAAPVAQLTVAGRLVIAGTMQAVAPAAVLSASDMLDRPGLLVAGGSVSTLTPGGTSSTLFASGQP